jgi:hypothetical protein
MLQGMTFNARNGTPSSLPRGKSASTDTRVELYYHKAQTKSWCTLGKLQVLEHHQPLGMIRLRAQL